MLARFTTGDEAPNIVLGNGGRTAAIGFVSDAFTGSLDDGTRMYLNLFARMMQHREDHLD